MNNCSICGSGPLEENGIAKNPLLVDCGGDCAWCMWEIEGEKVFGHLKVAYIRFQNIDTTLHERRREQRMENPEFRDAYNGLKRNLEDIEEDE